MSDRVSAEQRSKNMSRIRSSETKPEVILRKALFARGMRYRKNDKRLPGRPDIVFPRNKTVVFVHGCFWHRHEGCKNCLMPKTNVAYWQLKFERNRERDQTNEDLLKKLGWRVIVVWECEIERDLPEVTAQLVAGLADGGSR